MTDAETLSDHMYVRFSLDTDFKLYKNCVKYPRWNLSVFDKGMFEEVINFCLGCFDAEVVMKGEKRARWLTSTIIMACDCAARRTLGRSSRRCKYWWNDEIAEARNACMHAKRRLTCSRRRRSFVDFLELLERAL